MTAAELFVAFELPAATLAGRRVPKSLLCEVARWEAEAARIRSAAAKERQMARRVELTLGLQRVEAAKAVAPARL